MANLYVLLGPEVGEKADYVEAIRKKAGSGLETHSFYAFETRIADVVSLLQNGALFSNGKLVFVKDADQIKKKEDIDLLAGYLRNPSPDSILFLMSDETRLDEKLDAAILTAKPAAERKVFWELFESQKEQWIRGFFSRRGIRVEEDAIETILELVGNTTDALKKECENLALYFQNETSIGADAVSDLLYHSREESVFSLYDAMVAADFERALEILDTMLMMKDTEPAGLFGGLAWQFGRLKSLMVLADLDGETAAFRALRVSAKKAQSQFRTARENYSLAQVEDIIALISRYDSLCRSSSGRLQDILMELFLYAAMVRKADLAEAPSFFREQA
jgi:DNA polymerase III subunit delta